MNIVSEWLYNNKPKFIRNFPEPRDRATLADGTTLSIQANALCHCEPRLDEADDYSSVEVGFPSVVIDELLDYAEDPDNPTETVYGWVPTEFLSEIIEARGGFRE